MQRGRWTGSLIAVLALGCFAQPDQPARVRAWHEQRAELYAGAGAWSIEHNGYRHTYTPHTSRHPIALVVIGVTHELEEARRLARKARDALGMVYEDFEYRPDIGFTLPPDHCVETAYPCAPWERSWQEPGVFLSIEQGGYQRWRSREFIVVAAHGAPGSELPRATLTKARAAFPATYEVTTRQVWIEYSQTKLPD